MTTIICDTDVIINRIKNNIIHSSRENRTGSITAINENSAIDGESWINDYINAISADIFDKLLSPLARSLSDPFLNGLLYGGNNIIYNFELPSTFDTNTLPSVRQSIEDTIVSYAVKEWLKTLRVPGWETDEADHLQKYNNLRGLITRRINLKRTPSPI